MLRVNDKFSTKQKRKKIVVVWNKCAFLFIWVKYTKFFIGNNLGINSHQASIHSGLHYCVDYKYTWAPKQSLTSSPRPKSSGLTSTKAAMG